MFSTEIKVLLQPIEDQIEDVRDWNCVIGRIVLLFVALASDIFIFPIQDGFAEPQQLSEIRSMSCGGALEAR